MIDPEVYCDDDPAGLFELVVVEFLVDDLEEGEAVAGAELDVLVLEGRLRLHEEDVGLLEPLRVDRHEEAVVDELLDRPRLTHVELLTQVLN